EREREKERERERETERERDRQRERERETDRQREVGCEKLLVSEGYIKMLHIYGPFRLLVKVQ
ncbi:hypothetical protein, partial [Flavonifractor plautii]|uniref:hypothetical protein n=1 Tax=Flavonifractor plautii TaxID=292800 RepID=UPI003D7C9268